MTVSAHAPDGVPEVRAGDDLADLLLAVAQPADGDIVVVTSKVVSKAEGRLRTGDRAESLAEESLRLVARRGATTIVRTRLGLTLAAAGIDGSNVATGHHLLLPEDPDGSARRLRADILARSGARVGVIVSDTAGRAWRQGQTDIAIGAAGVRVLEEFHGRLDPAGNPLVVTAPAVADELAGLAELASGKLGRRPFCIISGRADLVLPSADAGRGADALVRDESQDLFGLGAREAVTAAVAAAVSPVRGEQPAGFGAPADADELAAAVREALGLATTVVTSDQVRVSTVPEPGGARALVGVLVGVLAQAYGWQVEAAPAGGPAGGDSDVVCVKASARSPQ